MGLPPPLELTTGRQIAVVACASIFPALATASVIARFIARYIRKVGLWWDDWLIFVALIACFGQTVIINLSVVYGGVGVHVGNLSPDNLIAYNKLIAAVQFSFGTSLGFVKLSICCLLIRVFRVPSFTKWAIAVMVYCTAWMIMTISIGAGLCRPFAYNWNKSIDGHCGDADAAYISIAALDIVGDLLIIILPMPMIWKLNVSTSSKVGLSMLFALGLVTVVISILRIVFLTQVSFTPTSDFTWSSTGTYIFSIIEPCLAVTVGCACALKPLFEACLPNMTMTWRTSQKSKDTTGKGYSNRSEDNDVTPLKFLEEEAARRYKSGRTSPNANDLEASAPESSDTSSGKRAGSDVADEVVINRDVVVQQQSTLAELESPRTGAQNGLLRQWEMQTNSNPHAK